MAEVLIKISGDSSGYKKAIDDVRQQTAKMGADMPKQFKASTPLSRYIDMLKASPKASQEPVITPVVNHKEAIFSFKKIEDAGKSAFSSLSSQGKSAASSLAGGLMGPLAAFGSAAGIAKLTSDLISSNSEIKRNAEMLSVSNEEYQRLGKMFSAADADIEGMSMAVKTYSGIIADAGNGGKEAAQKLALIGLTFDQLQGKSPAKQFEILAKAIGSIPDKNERFAALGEVFGKTGMRLNELVTNFDAYKAKADEATIMTDAAIEASYNFEKSIAKMGGSIKTALANSGLIEWLADAANEIDAVAASARQFEKLKTGTQKNESGLKGGGYGLYADNKFNQASGIITKGTFGALNGSQIEDAVVAVKEAVGLGGTAMLHIPAPTNEAIQTKQLAKMERQGLRDIIPASQGGPSQIASASSEADPALRAEAKYQAQYKEHIKLYEENQKRMAETEKAANREIDAIAEKNRLQEATLSGKGEELRIEQEIAKIKEKQGYIEPEQASRIRDNIQRQSSVSFSSDLQKQKDTLAASGLRASGNELGARLYESDRQRQSQGMAPMDTAEKAQMAQVFQGQLDLEGLKQQLSQPMPPEVTDRLARVGGYTGGSGSPANLESYTRQQVEIQKNITVLLQNIMNKQAQTALTSSQGYNP